jgi:hypothetical protein
MKRTKDRFGQFELYNKKHVSGLKVFDGEDLEFQDRKQFQQMQQDEWFKQQLYVNQKADEDQRKIKQKLADQELANYRMHCMLEAEHEQKVRDMNAMTLDYNKLLAECRRQKELKDKKKEEELDRRNYLDAEETRDFAYAHMKATIDHMKDNF